MDIKFIVNLTSKAWALPILALLFGGVAGRQAPLLVATGASRGALAQSIQHLIKLGLIERNPGHGHPLRPEFRLTDQGQSVGALALKIDALLSDDDQELLRRSWTLPVLVSLQHTGHFNDIKRSLQNITDRSLSQSLKNLQKNSWVCRRVDARGHPPRTLYRAINRGALLSQTVAEELAQANYSAGV